MMIKGKIKSTVSFFLKTLLLSHGLVVPLEGFSQEVFHPHPLFLWKGRNFFFLINLFICFYLFLAVLVFVTARGLSLVVVSGGNSLLLCARSRRVGFSICGLRALEHKLSSCGARAQLLHGMWDLPRTGLEPCIGRRILNHCTTREVPERKKVENGLENFHPKINENIREEVLDHCCNLNNVFSSYNWVSCYQNSLKDKFIIFCCVIYFHKPVGHRLKQKFFCYSDFYCGIYI